MNAVAGIGIFSRSEGILLYLTPYAPPYQGQGTLRVGCI